MVAVLTGRDHGSGAPGGQGGWARLGAGEGSRLREGLEKYQVQHPPRVHRHCARPGAAIVRSLGRVCAPPRLKFRCCPPPPPRTHTHTFPFPLPILLMQRPEPRPRAQELRRSSFARLDSNAQSIKAPRSPALLRCQMDRWIDGWTVTIDVALTCSDVTTDVALTCGHVTAPPPAPRSRDCGAGAPQASATKSIRSSLRRSQAPPRPLAPHRAAPPRVRGGSLFAGLWSSFVDLYLLSANPPSAPGA